MNVQVHRQRAEQLRERYPFAGEVLTLYLTLLDAWEEAAADWSVDRVVPLVVKATDAAGPEPLAVTVRELVEAGRVEAILSTWLAGEDQALAERYLARAALWPVRAERAGEAQARAATAASCPACGGPPQVSVRSAGGDPLVSGSRELVCARCGRGWAYSASSCPSCGETAGSKRTVYAESHEGPVVEAAARRPDRTTFPHLRVDACTSCHRYLIDVDLGRDARAVPDVDELAALPLDLYAVEHGFTKITPNLMGL